MLDTCRGQASSNTIATGGPKSRIKVIFTTQHNLNRPFWLGGHVYSLRYPAFQEKLDRPMSTAAQLGRWSVRRVAGDSHSAYHPCP